ncbi:putative pectate lyase A [Ceratocystis platani]|uniref:Putative pectate lyase A n=1 Tax=Ceratocystis fimbriata f. sp. platani TaxID=88771 RepID=A0A0F8DBS3_CERFI|nr:putative pectate lyase A [Ceratocystis platani]
MHSRVFVSLLAGAAASMAANIPANYGAVAARQVADCPAPGSDEQPTTPSVNPMGTYPTGSYPAGGIPSTMRTRTRNGGYGGYATPTPTPSSGGSVEAESTDEKETDEKESDEKDDGETDDYAASSTSEAAAYSAKPTSTKKAKTTKAKKVKTTSGAAPLGTGSDSSSQPDSKSSSDYGSGYTYGSDSGYYATGTNPDLPASTGSGGSGGSGSGGSTYSGDGTIIGYGAGTTGGGSGAGTTVTSCAELTSAAGAGGVVRVSGSLKGCGIIKVASDTSIIGVGADSGCEETGFVVKGVKNVIIQNLNLHNPPEAKDIIAVDKATQVWIDHIAFSSMGTNTGNKDFYDGLLDITHAADMVTVSYNSFKNHYKASLVGHSDSNTGEDTGFLHVTYHNNYWNNIGSRCPSIRFGTAHIFNNCYEDIVTSGVNSRMGAQVLVEGNEFINVEKAIMTNLDSSEAGFAIDKDNSFNNAPIDITQTCDYKPPYQYSAAPGAGICASVKASVGPTASL